MKHLLLAFGLLASPALAADAAADPSAQPSRPSDARLVPTIRDGQPIGLKVYAIQPGGRFARTGFLNGDLIEQIDGVGVMTDDGATRLHAAMVAGTRDASITVRRRGQLVTLAAKR